MPIVQLMILGLIIAAFGIFMAVLLSVSLYVSLSKQEAAPERTVTPARHPEEPAIANQTSNVRRFG